MRFLVRWLANSAGFLAAIAIIPGIQTSANKPIDVAVVVIVAGLINCIIGPVLKFFTLPFIIFTAGLGLLLVNMAIFWLAGKLGQDMGLGFSVSGFWATFFGALIVSIVSSIFGHFLTRNVR